MYLWWQRRVYGQGRRGVASYSVYVAESVRAPGAKRPTRRTLAYLCSVNPIRQREGNTTSANASACRERAKLWNGVERRLKQAVAQGVLTDDQRQWAQRELAVAVPPPTDAHRGADGRYASHGGVCRPAPLTLPAYVLETAGRSRATGRGV